MSLLTKIKPVPQILEETEGRIVLGALAEPNFKINASGIKGELALSAVALLEKRLSELADACAKKADGEVEIVLAISDKAPEAVKINADQAYSIEAGGNSIVLTGYGEAGLYYAVTTFIQSIAVEDNIISLPEFSLLDWPDLRTRGHFMECRFGSNLMTLEDWKGVVDDMVEMKMNQLVVALYGCWCIQYDGIISEYIYIPLETRPELRVDVIKRYYSPKEDKWINETVRVPMAEKDFFGDLIAYGKQRGVEIVPLWNSYGHNTLLPRKYPEVSAKDENGNLTSHGFCLSHPGTYELLYSIFDEIIDKYLRPNGIESFHIGLDEVADDFELATDVSNPFKAYSPWCKCEECSKLTNEEKFLNHAIKLISHLKSRGMKNVYIYSDMLTKIVKPENFKKLLVENDLLDVTVIDWWTYTNNKELMMFETMHPELGFRSTVKPWNSYYHWDMIFDSVPNVRHLTELAYEEQSAEGLQSYSAWDKSCDKNHMSMADYSWNFAGTGSVGEFNDRYAMREFPTAYEAAKRALALMDEITFEGLDFNRFSDFLVDKKGLSNVALMRSLTYYRYSYVKADKPYPRNFPGEPFSLVLSEKNSYTAQLREIAKLAKEALEIFERLSAVPGGNIKLAARFACEANNYLCVAEDYLALMEMYDILQKGERNAKVSERIAAIAAERKTARFELMLRIENVKEAFLIPSHLRNQTIFMQAFADIEAYVNRTSPEKLELDICDLRDIGSRAFYKLR